MVLRVLLVQLVLVLAVEAGVLRRSILVVLLLLAVVAAVGAALLVVTRQRGFRVVPQHLQRIMLCLFLAHIPLLSPLTAK
jgi:hypothetical protein